MELTEPTPMTQEVRFATTMTGGVSLAIWMAGVAREINLLSQASEWRKNKRKLTANGALSKAAFDSLKLYAKLIDLLDVLVEVDVLSGTSAGGINAALLASSRVRGSDLGKLREIWLDLGALLDLLRNPTDKTTPSLLYGDERMFKQLADELPNLPAGPFPPTVRHASPPTTVYITTTLLDGETSRFTDSFGTLVQDVDRRGVFTFTESDLKQQQNLLALALAARSSASFPAAFEPSFIPFDEAVPDNGDVPERPAMKPFTNTTRPHWAADGGLLDNQPIDVLLQRIFDSPAERPVRRVLLFVVPTSGPVPDLVKPAVTADVNKPLGLVDGLLKDLSAVTTQSIALDLRAFRTHQDRIEARTEAKLRLAEFAIRLKGPRLLTRPLLADYVAREAAKQADALSSALLRQLSTWPPASEASSRQSIPENWEQDLRTGGDADDLCRRNIEQVLKSRWSGTPAQPPPKTAPELARYGRAAIDLAKACALDIARAAYQVAEFRNQAAQGPTQHEAVATQYKELGKFTDLIHKALADEPQKRINIANLVEEVCTNGVVRLGTLANAASLLARKYLQQSTVPVDAWSNLGNAFAKLSGVSLQQRGEPTSGTEDEAQAVQRLQTYLSYLSPENPEEGLPVEVRLFDLAATQRAMLPAEADIDQSLELVQVSADTRSLLAPNFQTAEDKLTGMQFHHFSAFYKRSWRANDWMWGRVDAAGWLVHVLLDPRRVRWIVARNDVTGQNNKAAWFFDRLNEFGPPDFPDEGYCLPGGGSASDQKIDRQTVLNELAYLDDPRKMVPSSLPCTSMWVAQAWQRRILDDELTGLASTVLESPDGTSAPDWSPPDSKAWAKSVLAAQPDDKQSNQSKQPESTGYYVKLNDNPVAKETFKSDEPSPLMAKTLSKAAATTAAAVSSVRQLPPAVKPPLQTLRTVSLAVYRSVGLTKGFPRREIRIGAALLVLGVAFAIQSSVVIAAVGLSMAAVGGCLVALATWQSLLQRFVALLSIIVVVLVLAPACPGIAGKLFGTGIKDVGWLGRHVYWLGTEPGHYLVVLGIVAAGVTVIPLFLMRGIDSIRNYRLKKARKKAIATRKCKDPVPNEFNFQGFSLVNVKVPDCGIAANWWERTMGFALVERTADDTVTSKCLAHPSGLAVTLISDESDQRSARSNYQAVSVADKDELQRWQWRLEGNKSARAEILSGKNGPAIRFRAGDIKLELSVRNGNDSEPQIGQPPDSSA